MRVTCQKCSAAYAVDDKLIPPQGVRAQCPKCKALQVVKRPDGAGGLAPAGSSSAPAAGSGRQPTPPPMSGRMPTPAPNTRLPTPPPMSPGRSGPTFGGAAVNAPAVAQKGNTSSANPWDFDLGLDGPPPEPPPPAAKPAPAPAPVAAKPKGPLPGESAPVIKCRSCQTPLPDPLDAALGVCENCRSKEHEDPNPLAKPNGKTPNFAVDDLRLEPAPQAPAAPARAAAPAPAPKSAPPPGLSFGDELPAQGLDADDSGLELDIAPRPGAKKAAPARPATPSAPPPANRPAAPPAVAPPAAPAPNPAVAAAAAAAAAANPAFKSQGVAMTAAGMSTGAKVGIAAGVLIVAAVGGWFAVGRPDVGGLGIGRPKETRPKYLPALETRLAGWKMALVEVQGTSEENFQRGRKLVLEDKPSAYREAEEAFKAALVVDPNNLKCVAHLVEAFAVGRGETATDAERKEMRELLQAVLDVQPAMAVAKRAKANLLLATDQFDLARAEAEEAYKLSKDDEQAEALLAWGRTYLKKSAEVAREKIELALNKDPNLKRAYYYRGLSSEYAGRYAEALKDYDERLKRDDTQREALRAEARVYASLGDYKKAREALARYAAKHPDVGEPRVLMVQLAYAVERDLREADKTLRKLKEEADKFDDQDKLQFATLWAAVARERGEIRVAAEQVKAALKIKPDYGPAHFQALLTALAYKDVAGAREHLKYVEQSLPDPARVQEYVGRTEAVAERWDVALAAFRKASELAPSRVGPVLDAAAVAVRKGDEDAAYRLMKRVFSLDPTALSQQRRPVTDYFETPIDGVRLVEGAFDGVKASDEMFLARAYAAVVKYHFGDADEAARLLDGVLQKDSTFLQALLFRAQIEIDRRAWDKALTFAKRAYVSERESAVALYLMGRALEGQKKADEAYTTYLKALDLEPNLVPANLRVAGILAEQGKNDDARERLLKVASIEPDNVEARVALFKLGY